MHKLSSVKRGFTIVELIIVVIVIAIIASLAVIGYNAIIVNARDGQVKSDLEIAKAELGRYAAKNGGEYGSIVEWYSGATSNPNIKIKPGEGNIIDIVANTTGYCIRVYHPQSSNKTLDDAAKADSATGVCDTLTPSDAAIIGSGGTIALTWKDISEGVTSACGIASNNGVYCWGANTNGLFGNGNSTNSNVPLPMTMSGVLSGKTPSKVVSGTSTTCVLTTDNGTYCSGTNGTYGMFGVGSTTNSNVPVAAVSAGAMAGKTVKSLSIGSNHACAIASDDLAYCWGFNSTGQLGNASTATSTSPVAVSRSGVLAGKTMKSISVGTGFTCAIASDNLGYCWGSGAGNRLGRVSTSNSSTAVALTASGALSGKTLKSIFASNESGCALASDDMVYCWGLNSVGQLAANSSAIVGSLTPTAIYADGALAGKTVKSLMAGPTHACVIASDDKGYCWGANTSYQTGTYTDETPAPAYAPALLYSHTSGSLASKTLKQIGTSQGSLSCAIANDNKAYCWGANQVGQLGFGTTGTTRTAAQLVTSPTP